MANSAKLALPMRHLCGWHLCGLHKAIARRRSNASSESLVEKSRDALWRALENQVKLSGIEKISLFSGDYNMAV